MSTLQISFLAILFLAVSGFCYGLAWLALRPRLSERRLKGESESVMTRPPATSEEWVARMAALAAPLAKLALPAEGWESSGLRVRFLNAGLREPSWPMLYFAAKAGLALALPAVFLFSLGVGSQSWGSQVLLTLLLALATIGYYLPNGLLSLRVRSYQRELFEAFPDAIDLIIVCIEAGLALDAAIARATEELRVRSRALADELHLVGLELRVGASRTQALRNLAMRTGLEEAASLVNMLVQADRFGSSIADSLRVHADTLRTKRRMKAEEEAAKIALKLLFPLIFCIFPSLMVVLLGPAAINIYRIFLKSASGQ